MQTCGRHKIKPSGPDEKWPADNIALLCFGGHNEYSGGWCVIYGPLLQWCLNRRMTTTVCVQRLTMFPKLLVRD